MRTQVFIRRSRVEAPAEEVFRWHTRPGALERLTPPWEPVRIVERQGGVDDGGRVVLAIKVGPLRRRWVAEHHGYEAGRQFRDRQIEGPFAFWDHTHRVEPDGPDACHLEDRVEYALPLGAVGRLLGGRSVRARLDRVFAYRHRTMIEDLDAHRRHRVRGSLHVLVSGASGLIGSALVPFLTTGGHRVTRLVRSPPAGEGAVFWDPAARRLDPAALEGADAVVHLAGEPIARGRWTDAKKARIRDSRIQGTELLAEALARLDRPPRVLVSASAVGYYGDRGAELLRETSPPGTGFLAGVCRDWEAATRAAAAKGIRVATLRFGIVLSPAGGALARMLPPFRLGVGGRIGGGRQYMSWIAVDDAVGAIHHALMTDDLEGPVNVVAPQAVTNREFTRTLGRVLRRPTIFPVPAFAARLAFGELADALLLASARVEPARLLAAGYRFRHPDLEDALRHLLGRPARGAVL